MWKKRGKIDKFFYDHAYLIPIGIILFFFSAESLGMRYWGKSSWNDALTTSGLITLFIGFMLLHGLVKHDKT